MEILIATQNPGKLKEYRAILSALPVKVLSLSDVGQDDLDVEETGDTFTENAQLKAAAYARASEHYTLADDSGLCVDALDGGPGVKSARYAPTTAERNAKLLGALSGLDDDERGAYFACVIAFHAPDGSPITTTEGRLDGRIARFRQQRPTRLRLRPAFHPRRPRRHTRGDSAGGKEPHQPPRPRRRRLPRVAPGQQRRPRQPLTVGCLRR